MVHSKSETQTSTRIPGIFGPLLSLPVFYKVLFANSLIIFVGATGGTWLASNLGNSRQALATPTSLIIFVVVGWLVSIALNFVVLQVAFRPLQDLGKVMNRVQAGERSLRAPTTGVDPEADQLAQTFNMMLEAIDDATRLRASQIINAQEQERKRIARELHDETSQVLTSLLISLAILQESLTNTARHANAHKVLITMKEEADDVYVTIKDDGCGFDVGTLLKTPDQERGLGLAGMNERAVLLDGSLSIHSGPGHGTTIEVHIPLTPAEKPAEQKVASNL